MKLDVTIHHKQSTRVTYLLETILTQLKSQGVQIMAKFDEVSANFDALKAAVEELIREVGIMVAAGPGVVSQEQLDSLNVKILSVADAAKAADPHP